MVFYADPEGWRLLACTGNVTLGRKNVTYVLHEAFVRLMSEGGAGRGRSTALHYGYGRGIGVGRGRGVGVTRGPAVAVAVTVAVGVGVGAGKQKNSIELSGVPSLLYPPANHM